MKDWIAKLDDFLRISDREILDHPGTVSHAAALEKAEVEFEKLRQALLLEISPAEKDFEAAAAG